MSEEKLEKIETQLGQVLQAITVIQQNQNALREDVVALRHRIDSVEGTLKIAITDGFRTHDLYLDDLNTDLARNERQTRRLNRRIDRIERGEE